MSRERAREVFFEVFEPLPRQGPGSLACTERALALCKDLPAEPRILDLGCGSGAQTLHLAALTRGSIVAVDNHPPFVERLRARLDDGLAARVDARVADMTALDLEPESFDLVWSEGALYNLGLERALPLCAGLLKPGGHLAFTDAVWRTDHAPADVRAAFSPEYPSMGTAQDVLSLLQRDGWATEGHFNLPDATWWDEFYTPMEQRFEVLRSKYAQDAEALAVLSELAAEPQMHRDSAEHYGYDFFVARRP